MGDGHRNRILVSIQFPPKQFDCSALSLLCCLSGQDSSTNDVAHSGHQVNDDADVDDEVNDDDEVETDSTPFPQLRLCTNNSHLHRFPLTD